MHGNNIDDDDNDINRYKRRRNIPMTAKPYKPNSDIILDVF